MREDRTDEHHPTPTSDDWELEEDPLIFFDGLDIEEGRVDLPCDDDGQVFLAPHRKPEALRNDDKAKLLSDKLEVSAKTASVDESPVVKRLWSQSELGFEGDDDLEKTIEPIFEPSADQPVRMEVITDAFISQKILPGPGSQDEEPDDDENDWVGEQLTLPTIENDISADKPPDDKPVANKIAVSTKTILSSIGRIAMSSSRTIIQSIGALVVALGATLRAVLTKVGQILQTLAKKAAKFAMLSGRGVANAVKAAYSLCIRIGRRLAPRLYAASISLLNMFSKLGQGLKTGVVKVASAFRAKTGGLETTLRSASSTIGRAYLDDINKLMSLSKSVFDILMMKAARWSKTLSRTLADTSSRLGTAFSQLSSAGSALGIAALGRLAEATTKASQFLRHASGRAWKSTTQKLDRRALLGAKENSFIMNDIQKKLIALAPVFRMPTRMPLGGLASVAAVVVLLVAAWDDTPKSETPSVVLAFPPKPSGVHEELSHDPIIFDWPVIKIPQDETESVGADDDAAKAEPSLAEDRLSYPPEATSVDPVEDVALVGGGP